MSDDMLIFDARAVRAHRQRAAQLDAGGRFLAIEVQSRLLDRLSDMTVRFDRVLHLFGMDAARPPTKLTVTADLVAAFAAMGRPCAVVVDPEMLPFASGSFDLVVATPGLHWTNDLPGALLQIRRALRPDGLLLAALYGGQTLRELRESLLLAEIELTGGGSPRVAPFASLQDLAGLLQRAGFALPVADVETLTLTYDSAFALMAELRALGDTNALRNRVRHFTRRGIFLRAAEIYRERFADADDRIPATFQIMTLTAWSPAPSQPKPLRPGSATLRLADAIGGTEFSAGDKPSGRIS